MRYEAPEARYLEVLEEVLKEVAGRPSGMSQLKCDFCLCASNTKPKSGLKSLVWALCWTIRSGDTMVAKLPFSNQLLTSNKSPLWPACDHDRTLLLNK